MISHELYLNTVFRLTWPKKGHNSHNELELIVC